MCNSADGLYFVLSKIKVLFSKSVYAVFASSAFPSSSVPAAGFAPASAVRALFGFAAAAAFRRLSWGRRAVPVGPVSCGCVTCW